MACPVNVTIPSGFSMPAIGYGTWQAQDDELEKALEAALSAGYRHIDTACVYENEHVIGKVLKRWLDSGKVKREELFIVTKLPAYGNRPEDVEKYIKQSLEKLQLSYLDLYLVHAPVGAKLTDDGQLVSDPTTNIIAVWKVMEAQVDAGRTKAVGVSNYTVKQLQRILAAAKIPPVTNQVEWHAYLQQPQLVEYMNKNSIIVTAYSPLGTPGIMDFYKSRGMTREEEVPDILHNKAVVSIASKHGKSPAQVLLKHIVQRGFVAIPKSVNPDRIKQNITIFDFQLDKDDMDQLNSLDCNARIVLWELIKGIKEHPEYMF